MKQDSSHIDKWDILLDLLENPSKYSETQKDEILGDEEMMAMYRQMVEVRQALDSQKKNEEMSLPSIDAEWEKLKEMKSHEVEAKAKKQAKVVPLWSPMRKVAAVVAVLAVSGFAFAAIHLAIHSYQESSSAERRTAVECKDSVGRAAAEGKKTDVVNDSVSAKLPLLYENMELQDILKPIAQHFNLQVEYKSESSKHIRLYLQLTEQMGRDEIIEMMNHFEKVNVHVEGNILIVE